MKKRLLTAAGLLGALVVLPAVIVLVWPGTMPVWAVGIVGIMAALTAFGAVGLINKYYNG